jgi:hypothetical protein
MRLTIDILPVSGYRWYMKFPAAPGKLLDLGGLG